MERNTAKRTLEKLLSVCICLCMLGAMLPAQVFAEEADTAQTEIVQDTAPKDTVYLSSADDLIQLAENCRLDSWSQNRTVVLEADIDLSSVDFNGIPSFGGTWEGQNHAITGLSLSQDGSVQGLFRYVQQGALVRDMTVKGRIKPGGTRASVGGIAGSNAGTGTVPGGSGSTADLQPALRRGIRHQPDWRHCRCQYGQGQHQRLHGKRHSVRQPLCGRRCGPE